jgi:hypothetical protein
MLKKSASIVLASFRSSTYPRRFSEVGTAGGAFPFAKTHYTGERPHEVRCVPPPVFTRCGLAWDKARLGASGLGG